jgi:hypothetical protein
MSTITVDGSTGRIERREARLRTRAQVGKIGLGTIAVLTVLVAAWGGVVPYVGPLFGYAMDGGGAWHWSLAHSLLALAPGGVGVVIGLMVLAETRGLAVGRGRLSLATAGVIIALCGAWFVVGPMAWPVLVTHGSYVIAGSPLHRLEVALGYSLGTGVVLALFGGFTAGWASRHQANATTVGSADTTVVGTAALRGEEA